MRRSRRSPAPLGRRNPGALIRALLVSAATLVLAAVPALSADLVSASPNCRPAAPQRGSNCTKDSQCCAGLVCQSGACRSGCRVGGAFYAEGAKSPSNACLSCQPSVSTTSFTAVAEGGSCSDGNACTQTDTCQAGACTGGNPVVCAALDQCHQIGTCNPSNGICSNPPKPNGAACNDGNACTQTDTCQAVACVGGNPTVCTAFDACHVPGICDGATGVCSNPPAPDGTACDDRNACTQSDTCQAGACSGTNPQTCKWSKIPVPFPGVGGPQNLQLMMDGNIIAADGGRGHEWYRFTPDPVGGYAAGTWTQTPVRSRFRRTFYLTGMLPDGRYVVGGGEFVATQDGTGLGNDERSHFEVYDPQTNAWTDLPDYPNSTQVADSVLAPLPDGRLLVAAAYDNSGSSAAESMVLDASDPANPSWSTARTAPCLFPFREATATMLQTGEILVAGYKTGIDRYAAGAESWSACLDWPNDPALNPYHLGSPSDEGGPALTLYDGRVFVGGATGHNAIYDPVARTIVNVADTPGLRTMHENDQVVMATGKVLTATTLDFLAYTFFEYDPRTDRDTFTDVNTGAPDFHTNNGNLVQTPLPDGSVMVADVGFKDVYIYTPVGLQLTAFGQPTITSITGPVNGVFTLTGTTLNGLTNGASRDDEGHNYTSFPIVSVTYAGQTRYCNVRRTSSMAIAPGATSTVQFSIPPEVPHGITLTVRVSASGLASKNAVSLAY
jgi:hypothetical protein